MQRKWLKLCYAHLSDDDIFLCLVLALSANTRSYRHLVIMKHWGICWSKLCMFSLNLTEDSLSL